MKFILILVWCFVSLAGASQNSSAFKVMFLDQNEKGIPNQRAFLISENDTLQIRVSDNNGIARFDSLPIGIYDLGIKTDYCYTRKYKRLTLRAKATMQVVVDLNYPCSYDFCNPIDCPSKVNDHHKVIPVKYDELYAIYGYYFEIKNNLVIFWDDRLDKTCVPHFYCKRHHAFF